jgi:hypothetical protein
MHADSKLGALVVSMLLSVLCLARGAAGDVPVYTQAPYPAGGQYKSSWWAEEGMDNDEYVWDGFTLASNAAITKITWRGGYAYGANGMPSIPIYDFTIAIYGSIGTFQPDIVNPPLVRYRLNSNAGETSAGTVNGVPFYDYTFSLPSAFQAAAGTKYWLQIEAWQGLNQYFWPPDWSIARGSGGDGSHFRKVGGTGGTYASLTGDAVFTLFTSGAPTFTINASVSPANSGTITGAGIYPSGSTATLAATPAAGYAFQRWTENGTTVSSNPSYTFSVNASRTLVVNFITSYNITTQVVPAWAGTSTGDGSYTGGSSVTISANPIVGFDFLDWSDQWGWFSGTATTTFAADADHAFTASLAPTVNTAVFDFDTAPVHTSLPLDLFDNGLVAHLSATGGGYSIQPANTMGFMPHDFAGLCVYPNSVFAADLLVSFDKPLSHFSILYSPQELGCDDSATMRVTAFAAGVQVGTATTTAATPGTWPSQRLAITVPAGFDSVVVHYDHRPPTCQDYGVIFLADNMVAVMLPPPTCGSSDYNGDGDYGTDQDIEAFFACLGGNCCGTCWYLGSDFNGDGDYGTDADIESFFRVLAGGNC